MSLSLIIKWGGQEYTITSLSEEDTVLDLKQSLKGLTGVLPERQKLLGLKMKGNCPHLLFAGAVPEVFRDKYPLILGRMCALTGHPLPSCSSGMNMSTDTLYITGYCLLLIHLPGHFLVIDIALSWWGGELGGKGKPLGLIYKEFSH